MKSHRRIEITAFSHRLTLIGGDSSDQCVDRFGGEVLISNAETSELIDANSIEGKRVITDAINLLQNSIDASSE